MWKTMRKFKQKIPTYIANSFGGLGGGCLCRQINTKFWGDNNPNCVPTFHPLAIHFLPRTSNCKTPIFTLSPFHQLIPKIDTKSERHQEQSADVDEVFGPKFSVYFAYPQIYIPLGWVSLLFPYYIYNTDGVMVYVVSSIKSGTICHCWGFTANPPVFIAVIIKLNTTPKGEVLGVHPPRPHWGQTLGNFRILDMGSLPHAWRCTLGTMNYPECLGSLQNFSTVAWNPDEFAHTKFSTYQWYLCAPSRHARLPIGYGYLTKI